MKVDHGRDDDGVRRLWLRAGRGNILDLQTVGELTAALEAGPAPRALVLSARGDDFSFGASIQEHRAAHIADYLAAFTRLLRRLAEVPAPTLVAVRGRCLGGGLELALACDLILAEAGASFGCPEIELGVFPPYAAVLLPPRIGTGRASQLTLEGQPIDHATAQAWGLVQEVTAAGALDATVEAWLDRVARGRSRRGLGHAALASRAPLRRRLEVDVPRQVARYLDGLCATPVGFEGIEAFLAKRAPRWPDDQP